MTTENEQIWNALDDYFERAGEDEYTNIQIAQPFINRWGNAFICGGPLWIAWRLEKEGHESAKNAMMGMSDAILDLMLFMLAKSSLEKYKHILDTLGNDAGKYLFTGIGLPGDEDAQALSAYLFGRDYVKTLDSRSADISRIFLKTLYPNLIGTSCKLAVSWARYNLGDEEEFEKFIYNDSLWGKDYLELIEEVLKLENKSIRRDELKHQLISECAIPKSGPLDAINPHYLRRGILEALALDIASNGKVFQHIPNWQRKTA